MQCNQLSVSEHSLGVDSANDKNTGVNVKCPSQAHVFTLGPQVWHCLREIIESSGMEPRPMNRVTVENFEVCVLTLLSVLFACWSARCEPCDPADTAKSHSRGPAFPTMVDCALRP